MNKKLRCVSLQLTGQVQGVGFRPLIYQLAKKYRICGWVNNDASGINIVAQGEEIQPFIDTVTQMPPPLAKITHWHVHERENIAATEFSITQSQPGIIKVNPPPDGSLCDDCLTELFDPSSRYYLYPFINCSHCGPRYTLTQKLPYDRCNTTMSKFALCAACEQDYLDANNRRYHAQPTACPQCGPQLSMPIEQIVQRINDGEIVAIKGIGGYHLICDAHNEATVSRLRQKKQRNEKPFAVMVPNIASAKQWSLIDGVSENLLDSHQRPIVLLPKIENNLAPSIAPNLNQLGIMLPPSPLHYLLFYYAAGEPKDTQWLDQPLPYCWVMTSANPGGEPLVINHEEAEKHLSERADVIVDHNRDILQRCDDSVLKVIDQKPIFIRRSRGYVPEPIQLPHEVPPTLAVGGYLKNTICLTRGNEAFLSQHIGILDSKTTRRFFNDTIDHLKSLLGVTPERVAHDLHPDFYSTRYAQSLTIPNYPIQHHHAHLAAVVAEHQITEPTIGLALDGFGMGENKQSWGGELFLLDGVHYERLGHLSPLKQPGGDQAAKEPWRMGIAFLFDQDRKHEISSYYQQYPQIDKLSKILKADIHCPPTSSCGRLFDTASALLRLDHQNHFDGQAAMYLESLVTKPTVMENGWFLEPHQLNLSPLLNELTHCDQHSGANLFHGTLIAALTDWLVQTTSKQNINSVVLGGGCFLNSILTEGLVNNLREKDLIPYLPRQVPVNDAGISLGQAWIAGNS